MRNTDITCAIISVINYVDFILSDEQTEIYIGNGYVLRVCRERSRTFQFFKF